MEDQAEYKTNPKGGRPQKDKNAKLETTTGVRFSVVDRVKIRLKAEAAGLSVSDYIRQAAVKGAIKRPPTPEEKQLYRDFTGAVNNLNQLTKLAHQQGLSMIAPQLLKLINDLNQLTKQLNDHKN